MSHTGISEGSVPVSRCCRRAGVALNSFRGDLVRDLTLSPGPPSRSISKGRRVTHPVTGLFVHLLCSICPSIYSRCRSVRIHSQSDKHLAPCHPHLIVASLAVYPPHRARPISQCYVSIPVLDPPCSGQASTAWIAWMDIIFYIFHQRALFRSASHTGATTPLNKCLPIARQLPIYHGGK